MRNRRTTRAVLLLALLLLACSTRTALETGRAIPIPIDRIEVDDGDTFSFDRTTIRVLGIDTPEIAHPAHGLFEDQAYGREATARAKELIFGAKRVSYLPYQNDRYGRLLAHVFLDGELLGVKLIEEGLAYETISHYGDQGFPEIAEAIRKAAENAPEPHFQPPYLWRREHRKE